MRYLLILVLGLTAYSCTRAGAASYAPVVHRDPPVEGLPSTCRQIMNHNSALEPGADAAGRVYVGGYRYICDETVPEGKCLIVTRWRAWGEGSFLLVAERDGRRIPKLLAEGFGAFANPVTGLKFHAGDRIAIAGQGSVAFQAEGYFVEAH